MPHPAGEVEAISLGPAPSRAAGCTSAWLRPRSAERGRSAWLAALTSGQQHPLGTRVAASAQDADRFLADQPRAVPGQRQDTGASTRAEVR
jgi:hypothetical protein